MSMDEQHHHLIQFTRVLDEFNHQIASSFREVNEEYDQLAGVWQDDMRRQFDKEWLALRELMDTYVKVEGPRYIDFLQVKIRLLERYLHGS